MSLGVHWQYPWMFCIALIPVVLYLLSKLGLSHLKRFADGHLLPWLMYGQHSEASSSDKRISSVFYIKILLHCSMWLLLAVAAAGPRRADQESQNRLLNSVDIMVLLDVSRSMQATDIVPNRLARARVELLRLIDRVKGDRVGLIVYGGRSLLVTPPTRDKAVVRFYLDRLRDIDIPVDGSNLLSAVQLADKTYQFEPVDTPKRRARAILVVSDGEISNQSQGPLINQKISSMTANGIKFYSMGVGTLMGGTIPDAKQHWLKYNNQLVKSTLNEQRLKQLAATGRGRYARLENDQTTLNTIYDRGIAKQASYSVDAGKQKYLVWKNLYSLPLLLGISIMVLLLMPVQYLNNIFSINTNPIDITPDKQSPSSVIKMCMLILVLTLNACSSSEQGSFNQAKKLYLTKQYSQSLNYYNNFDITQLDSSRRYQARMAAGSSAYRLAKWNIAVIWFQRAFLDSVSSQQKAQALFNMANAWAKAQNYLLAIQIYRDALIYAPGMNRAKINLELVIELYKNKSSDPGYDFSVTSRLGKGPRSRRAIPGLKLNKGSTSIDNSPEKKDESGKGYRYDLGDNQLPAKNKLPVIKFATTQTQNYKEALDNVVKLALYELKQKISATNKNPKIMWRRLFFYENKMFIPNGERVTFPQDKPW